MAVTTQAELLLALERGQFDSIIDTQESDWIDFKEAPYQLQQPHQRWELAKDVAAFANGLGGVIIIGYRTRRPENALVDIATEHRRIQKGLINWDAYRQTIASWVYPHLEFARFFHRHLRPLHEGTWSLWLSVVGLDRDGGVVLVPMIGRGGEMARFWRSMKWEQRGPLRPTAHVRFASTGQSGTDAYRLLVEFYALFGAPPTDIPFVENGSVSEQRLLADMG